MWGGGGGGGGPDPLPPSGSAHGTGLCLHLVKPHFIVLIGFLYDTLRTFYRSTSRERDACSFEFCHFFNSESSSTYFKDSCISLQKNLTEWLYYIINGICADGEQAKSVWKNESVAIVRG